MKKIFLLKIASISVFILSIITLFNTIFSFANGRIYQSQLNIFKILISKGFYQLLYESKQFRIEFLLLLILIIGSLIMLLVIKNKEKTHQIKYVYGNVNQIVGIIMFINCLILIPNIYRKYTYYQSVKYYPEEWQSIINSYFNPFIFKVIEFSIFLILGCCFFFNNKKKTR